MTQKATHWISECSPEQCSLLAQKESALAQAQARIAALEAQLTSALTAPDSLVPPAPNLAQRYAKLLACSADHITLLDAQGQICYTNGTGQLLGYSSATDAGLAPLDFVHPEDHARLQAFLQTLAATPNSTQILEVRGRQKAGHEVWLEIKGNNLLPDPDVNALVLISRNITEAKQALSALQRDEKTFRHTFEQAAVGIAHIGLDLHLLRCNQRYSDIMGYTQAELDQHGVANYAHPADMASDRQAARQLLAGEIGAYHTQKRYLHKDGCVRWVNLTVSLVRTPDGQPDFFISVVEDISQLKQTEAALQRSSERYQRVVEDQLDMICRYNAGFQLTFVNQAYCTVLGKSAEELVGVNFLTLAPPGESDHIRAKIQALRSDHPVATSETVYTLPNGELHWFEWVDRALFDPEGKLVEYQGVGRDITAQKQLQLEQQRYTQAIEEMRQFLNSTINAIASSIAVLNTDGSILKVNEYWRRFALFNGAESPTGYVGENYLTVCDSAAGAAASEAAPVASGIRAVIEGQREHFYLEYPCHSPTKEHWFGVRVMPFAEPPPRRVVIAHIDITERVQAEKVENQQRRFAEAVRDALAALTGALNVEQMMQQILTAAITVIPSEGGSIILFEGEWSRVAYLRGFSVEADAYYKATRFPLAQFTHGNNVAQGQAYFTPDTQTTPDWFPAPGSEWIRSSMGAPITLHGEVIGLLCVDSATPNYFQQANFANLQTFAYYAGLALQNAQHLTQLEARVAERTVELQTAKERVEAILNHSFDGILLVRPDLRIAQTNAAFNKMFAGAPDDIFVGTISDLIYLEDVTRTHTAIQRVLTTQLGEQIEIRCYHKDGTLFDAELSIGPLKGAGIVCTLRDITERKQAEQALQESQRFSQKITETVPNVIYIFDFQAGRNIYINQNMGRLLGYAPEAMQGIDSAFVEQLMHPDDIPIFAAQLRQFTQAGDGQIFEIEYRLRHANGTWRWFLSSDTVFTRDEAGRVQQVLGIATDITARKQMENALRESEARYRLLAENVTDLIAGINALGICTYISPSCQTMLGYAPEEIIGQSAYGFIHPDDISIIQAMQSGALTKQTMPPFQVYRLRHKAGHYLWVEMNSHNVCDPATGEVIEFISVIRDITERKRAAAALREQHDFLQLIINNVPDLIGVKDREGRFQLVNAAAARLQQLTPAEIIGKRNRELNSSPTEIAFFEQTDRETLARGQIVVIPEQMIQDRYYHITKIPLKNATGEADRLLIVSFDITERKAAEAAAREQRDFLQQVIDHIPAIITVRDWMGRYQLLNRQAAELYHVTSEMMIGKTVADIYPDPAQVSTFNQEDQLVFASGCPSLLPEVAALGRYFEVNRIPIRNTTGQIDQLLIVSNDITERKQAEAAIKASERKYRQLVETMQSGLIIFDKEARVTYVNDRFCAISGYTREEVLGLSLFTGIALQKVNVTRAQFEKRMQGESSSYEFTGKHKNGGTLHLLASASPLFNDEGEVTGSLTVLADISLQKQSEAALRRSEEQYRNLVETMHGGLVIFGIDGRATYINDRACAMLGYTREEVLGHYATEFMDAENGQITINELAKRKQGESTTYELTVRHKDGQLLHILISASPLRNDQQEIVGTLSVLLDISIQKQAEATLRENLQKEKELGELKSRFVSMASHEFRTPLASILALTETLRAYRHKLADEQIDQRLGKIQEQIGYLKAMMEDVLQLARIQARRAEFNPVQLDLDALALSIIEEFQSNPAHATRLVYDGDPTLQSAVLDKKLIRQVLSNLISNGLKYSPPDKPVTIKLMREEAQLVLTVCDEGIGIPEADLAHLFEPFHRATNVGAISGTGLGLVIAKEAVELHGGAIAVETKTGAGTLVTVRIPLPTPEVKSVGEE